MDKMFKSKATFNISENEEIDINDNQTKIKKEKPNKTSFWDSISQIYSEYCSNTSIHGIQYLGERRPWMEKLFWLAVFIISMYCCTDLISKVYIKWNETPVIVSFSEKSTPVWSIPFPAVTICSETKRVPANKGSTYGELYNRLLDSIDKNEPFNTENITKNDLDEFRTLLQICNTQIIDEHVTRLSPTEINYFDVLEKMAPDFNRYYLYCKWFSHFGNCNQLFSRTYTEEGICFTFNGLSALDLYREDTYQYQLMATQNLNIISNQTLSWSLEDGYLTEKVVKTYPARVLAAGARAGLFIALQSFKQELDYACRGPVQGFKVLLHSPDDVPHVSKQFVRIPMGKEILIAVKPNMITTSAGIAEYEPIRRQCYLNGERPLKFFKHYTQSNCELECLANFTLNKCGCVKFSMPHTINTPVCSDDKIHCYDRAEDDLLMHEFNEGLQEADRYGGVQLCNCMPACTSLVYNTEISQGSFDVIEMLQANGDTSFMEKFPGSQMSRLSIYFKENQFITSKRSQLYGLTDFLANCGGIFGLFMGFSFLSLIEVVYHFTLRLWSNIHVS